MSSFPTGVAIVAAVEGRDRPIGMTCSSVCSVSLVPPTLLVCLRIGSPTLGAAVSARSFSVNLLHAKAQRTAELFASGAPDRFDRVSWWLDADGGGPHLTADAHTVADCRVSAAEQVGDHVVLFGEVFRVCRRNNASPLLYGLRRYRSWSR